MEVESIKKHVQSLPAAPISFTYNPSLGKIFNFLANLSFPFAWNLAFLYFYPTPQTQPKNILK